LTKPYKIIPMKNLIFISILLFLSCKSTKEMTLPAGFQHKFVLEKTTDKEVVITKTVEIQNGKQIELKKDGIGKYYIVTSDGNKVVFVIRVARNLKEPLPDSAMEYSLTFETDNPVKSFTKENEALRDIKAVYGFHAFHPDSGYYPLDKGKISLKTDKKNKKFIITVELPGKYGKMLNGTYEVPVPEN